MEGSNKSPAAGEAASAPLPGRRSGSNRRRSLLTDLAAAAVVLALVSLAVAVVFPPPYIPAACNNSGTGSNSDHNSNCGLASKLLHLFCVPVAAAAMALRSLFKAGTLALALPSATSASLLYVASYAGNVTTFNLTLSTEASLDVVATSDGCAPNPSWLTLDYPNATLYCLDEGLSTVNGTLSSYSTKDDGSLVQLDKVDTINGPVNGAIYGTNGHGLVLAEYVGSSLSSYDISDPSALKVVQTETFTLDKPGPNPIRQNAPHPHEVLIDPTGQYLLAPDLGADLVRIYALDPETLERTAVAPLVGVPGTGPRHGVFLVTEKKTFYFLVTELGNTITTYDVEYNQNNSLSFHEVFTTTSHGGADVPAGATAAEITLSPDEKFLIVSSRGEGKLMIPSFDPDNCTEIPSDPIMTFTVDHDTGALDLIQTFPAGGMIPRHFSINKAGTLLAVGLQGSGRVVIIDRDVETGKLKDFIANAEGLGEVTCAIFDE